jgi:hypothetical protein
MHASGMTMSLSGGCPDGAGPVGCVFGYAVHVQRMPGTAAGSATVVGGGVAGAACVGGTGGIIGIGAAPTAPIGCIIIGLVPGIIVSNLVLREEPTTHDTQRSSTDEASVIPTRFHA